MKIPDTLMVRCTCGNFSQRHNLMCIGLHRNLKIIYLPILHKSCIDANMGTAYTGVMLYRFKEDCYGLTNFHLHKSNTDTLPTTGILFLIPCHLFFS